jgi:hypothetical protein
MTTYYKVVELNRLVTSCSNNLLLSSNGPYPISYPSVQFPGISVTILEVLYVVYIIITSVHQTFWINRINSSWVTASWKIKLLTSALFSNAFRNCVKNPWLRLRRDFLPDINKNLNILAMQTCLYSSIWFLDKCLVLSIKWPILSQGAHYELWLK